MKPPLTIQEQYYQQQLELLEKQKQEQPWIIASYALSCIIPFFGVFAAVILLFRGRIGHAAGLLLFSLFIGAPISCMIGAVLVGVNEAL